MRILKWAIGLCLALLLTGCFGENYDFSPPTVSLVDPNNISEESELAKANVKWDYDKKYNKKTDDINSLAQKQEPIKLKSGQQVDFLIEEGHFDPDGISIVLSKNQQKIDLEVKNEQTFSVPKEKGEYLIEVNLNSDKGKAQYVGEIIIQ